MKTALRFAAIAATVAIAAPALAQDAATTTTIAAPAGDFAPIKTKSGTIAAAPADKAQVVFWRPGTLIGGAMGCTVREGEGAQEVQVARLGAGKYAVLFAEPGKHVFWTTGEATDRMTMELEAGETYFVRCSIGMGFMSGRAQVSPSDRDAFAKKAKGMKQWVKKEGGDDADAK
ncbi:hypothetical protein TPR58_03865 [Sphingomonas sp. HF-S3]|uniref:DUF2846 domain-containing protein n=1 Tax=Sphingomonas rustica TaxID=3103142 RepID=A0ABV0B6Z0_9SPHN